MTTIKFKRLYADAKAPCKRPGDAGWDLSVHSIETSVLSGKCMMKTGIAVEIPSGFFGLLRPRSSLSKTRYLFQSSGVIDSSYRGEIIFPLALVVIGEAYKIGDRICQILILPLPDVEFQEVEELSETVRGDGGFGSTGNA